MGNLSSVLVKMLEQLSFGVEIYIILDALDECEADSRMLILKWMKELIEKDAPSTTAQSSMATVKILVTSRPDGAMADHLSGFPQRWKFWILTQRLI